MMRRGTHTIKMESATVVCSTRLPMRSEGEDEDEKCAARVDQRNRIAETKSTVTKANLLPTMQARRLAPCPPSRMTCDAAVNPASCQHASSQSMPRLTF
ncbi:hypothetical protein TcWFU_006119 [Taenia crassiceps]|uniref:Uncharacterized protein n=1 Tax=Taenia crassiceps TaxID=6207 RepID=A0ABR4QH43_9CEST